MKSIIEKLVVTMLIVSIVVPASAAEASQTKKNTRKSTAKAVSGPAVTAEDIRELREMLQQQQQEIEDLRRQLQQRDEQTRASQQSAQQAQEAAQAAAQKAETAKTAATTNSESFTQMQKEVKDMRANVTRVASDAQDIEKHAAAAETAASRFRWTGDIRVRQEDFFFGCTETATVHCPPRVRERIRVRFGFEGKLGEDFIGGAALATGALFDPTTTNETLTNAFERKSVGLDKGYVTYNPHGAKWLAVTGGKFAPTWQKTSVTFDPDLNPEGFSEKLAWNLDTPVLKNISIGGMQLFFNEASAAPDSYAVGGQFATKLQLGRAWTMTPSYTVLNWRNENVLLNAPTSVTGGTTVGPFAPNGLTNNTIGTGADRVYASRFLYSDLILTNSFKTPWERMPITLLGEYEENLRAVTNASKAFLVDASLGQTKDKGDWQLGYAWLRQEQDSVISSFNEGDQRAPTNVLQHRFYFLYKVQRNTVLSYTQWIGRTLNTSLPNALREPGVLPGEQDPFLKRAQFDVVYSF